MPDKNPRKRKIGATKKGSTRKKVIRGEIQNRVSELETSSTLEVTETSEKNLISNKYPIAKFVQPEVARKFAIAVISGMLLFGAGVQIGSQSGTSTLDQAIKTIIDAGAKDLDRDVLERAAIEGALKASGDQWANYFPKSALEVLDEQNSNVFTGIGVWLNKTRGGQIQIASIQENSPAATSGLNVGDQILEVNGTDVRGASLM